MNKAGVVVPGGVSEQTEQICQNILSALKAVGTSIENVVKVNVSVTLDDGLDDLILVRGNYRSFWSTWRTSQLSTMSMESTLCISPPAAVWQSDSYQRMCYWRLNARRAIEADHPVVCGREELQKLTLYKNDSYWYFKCLGSLLVA